MKFCHYRKPRIKLLSPPVWGAWVEIPRVPAFPAVPAPVAPRVGGVG